MTDTKQIIATSMPALALIAALTGCSSGGDSSATTSTDTTEMTQSQVKATIPRLKADGEHAANALLDDLSAGSIPSDAAAFAKDNPLGEHHYFVDWEAGEQDSGAGTFSTGRFCIEYRPAEQADPVAFVLYSVSHIPAQSTVPAKDEVTFGGSGRNTGC